MKLDEIGTWFPLLNASRVRTDLSIVIGAMREVTAAADQRIINQGGVQGMSGDGVAAEISAPYIKWSLSCWNLFTRGYIIL